MFRQPEHIELKNTEQLLLMREAGLVVARALQAMSDAAAPGVSTGDLDDLARRVLADAGATSSFLGYERTGQTRPALVAWFLRRRHRGSFVVAWRDVAMIDEDPRRVHLRKGFTREDAAL